MMDGELSVHSVPGEGSTFTFSAKFPIEPVERALPSRSASLNGRRVLIVDDSSTNRSILSSILDRCQTHVVAVEDGVKGLEAVRRSHEAGTPFDVVLLDMSMPDMDGLMVAETLRSDPAFRAPILLLTSAGRSATQRAAELGLAGISPSRSCPDSWWRRCGASWKGPRRHARSLRDASHAAQNQNRWRLLLAEDNPVNRTMITRCSRSGALRETGRARAPGARGARGRVLRSRLMDLQMPSWTASPPPS